MTIKAVLFDIGGVLTRFAGSSHLTQWEQRLGIEPGTLAREVFHSPVAQQGFIGQATDDEVWQSLADRFQLAPEELATLRREFWLDEQWDEELLEWIRGLRPRYYTGVISDALPGARHEPRVLAHVNDSLFDVILYSGEEGVKKPAAQIFDKALGLLGVERGEAVFIDDTLRIVEGARALGLHAIQFISREQMLAELRGLLES